MKQITPQLPEIVEILPRYFSPILFVILWCDEIENDKFQSEKELVTFKHIIIKLIIPKIHGLYSISVIYDMVGNILV